MLIIAVIFIASINMIVHVIFESVILQRREPRDSDLTKRPINDTVR